MVTIESPAAKRQIMRILMAGAPPASVARLLHGEFDNLDRGASYVLIEDGQPLAASGFVRIEEPSPVSLSIAGMRPVFVLWFLSSRHAAPHVRLIATRARAEMRALAAAGCCVLADIDAGFSSAKKLARLCGMLPRVEVEGHHLWEFTDAPIEKDNGHGSDLGTIRREESRAPDATAAGAGPAERPGGAGDGADAAEQGRG